MAAPRPDLRIEALASHHDRVSFTCGMDSLDRYLRTQASQDVRRKAKGVFALVKRDRPETVLGYYTLCASGLAQGDVPAAARRHIPRYPLISATLIERLAVSELRQRQHLGTLLLADAVRRAYASAGIVGASMLAVDAPSVRASAFFEMFGFAQLPDSRRLVMPMHAVELLVAP